MAETQNQLAAQSIVTPPLPSDPLMRDQQLANEARMQEKQVFKSLEEFDKIKEIPTGIFTIQDVLDFRHKFQMIDVTKKYDPEFFWKHMGQFYLQTFPRKEDLMLNADWLIYRLKTLNVKKVLEVGAGFARLAPFLLEAKACETWEGVEFSPTMIESSKQYLDYSILKTPPLKTPPEEETEIEKNFRLERLKLFEDINSHITLKQGNALDLPYEDKSFDLVYTHACLMHIPPHQVQRARSEIARVAKNYIVCLERFAYDFEHPEPHRWSYNTAKAFNNMGWEVLESKLINPVQATDGSVFRRRG